MRSERLTGRDNWGGCVTIKNGTSKDEIWERLAELEDKIENGTLIIVNQPFVILDYISNGKEYYAVRIAEEKDLAINLTKAEAEKKLEELKG